MSLDYDDDGRSLSSETRAIVEEEVKVLLEVCSGARCAHAARAAPSVCTQLHSWVDGVRTALCTEPLALPVPLQAAYERARNILTSHIHELHALAGALLEKETLSGEQIRAMLAEVRKLGGSSAAPGQQSAVGLFARMWPSC